jgi:lysophospholipase L1-like esterase
MRALIGVLSKSFITTIIFIAAVEGGLRVAYVVRNTMVRLVPLPYALGDDYGPLPPWLDRLLILVPDNTLIWHSLPNAQRTYVDIFSPAKTAQDRVALLRRFSPTLPETFRHNPTWRIALNSRGDRTDEYARVKRPGVVRIACIGDSWTFGMNVDQDQTYPSRLQTWLRERRPGQRYEVLNFGVLGYTSFQGLRQLRNRVLELHPDILAIGFGMNDSEVAGYRDKDMTGAPRPRIGARATDAAAGLELWKLLNYVALAVKFHPQPIDEYLKSQAGDGSGTVDYDTIEPWTRVSTKDYDRNVREMISLQAANGGGAILLDNELWDESPYRPVLRRIAADLHVPLVDSLQLVDQARHGIERNLEAALGLASSPTPPAPPAPPARPGPGSTTVVFRVSPGRFDVARAMSIVGTDPQLGGLAPNTALMHDDGMDGDERAGDGVWSYTAAFPAGTRLSYVYTNGGERGRWEGLDVPAVRHITVPASSDGRPAYLPIETFGRIYMQADNWHTDATGYERIARAVAEAIP